MIDWQAQFEREALPHFDSLLRFARRRTTDDSSARDIVQETLFRAWKAFGRLSPDSNIRAWLFRILRHTAVDVCCRETRNSVQTVPLCEGAHVSVQSEAESLEILEVLRALPDEQRKVLLMAVVDGFKCREISEVLGIPIGTVMSRLSRARQTLRAALMPESVNQ